MERTKRDRLKIIIIFAGLLLILAIVLTILLSQMVTSKYRSQMETKLLETNKNLDKSLNAIQLNEESFVKLQQINTELAVFYESKDDATGLTQSSMIKLAALLSVYNVILLDNEGNVITSARPVEDDLDFTDEEAKALLEAPFSGSLSDPVYFSSDDYDDLPDYLLYSARIDNEHILVVMADMTDAEEESDSVSSWRAVLERNTIGQKGFTFAVNTDGVIQYFPYDPAVGSDSDPINGVDISEAGLKLEDFQDGSFDYMDIGEDRYYCGFKYRPSESAWIVCALPVEEINTAVIAILMPMLFSVFVIFSTLWLAFAMILKEYQLGTEGLRVRTFFVRKSRAFLIFSLLLLLILSVYIHLLYETSVQESVNSQDAKSLAYSINDAQEGQERAEKNYGDFLLKIAGITARFISDNPDLAVRSSLNQLTKILQTEHILLYDKNGTVIVSDSTYKGLTLSTDPDDPSYQFRQLLYGTPYVLEKEPDEDYLEKPYVYVGSLVTDEEGDPNGFVQLVVDPAFLTTPVESLSKEYVLSTYSGTNSSHVFAVDMLSGDYSYHPRKARIGKAVADYGITQKALRDGYVGYIMVRGVKYFCVSAAANSDYVFVVTPASNLLSGIYRISFFTFLPCFVAVCLFYILLLREFSLSAVSDMVAGTTEEAEFRSEDALKTFLKGAFLVFSGVVFIIFIFRSKLLPKDSIFTHIMGSDWESGVNLFSVTWCVICICSVGFVTICLTTLLLQLGNSASARTKTMSRMLISLIKYAAIIGILFCCAKKLGVETDTLLASAGILTVVIGLGAQSLTSDVFDGLFIIIEGAFHVGDVISVDDWRGKVLEIGIRNTKLLDLDNNNTKIINNSALKKVQNHSIKPECLFLSIGIDYDEKLGDIEEIILREMPVIKDNMPLAVEGPTYLGVDAFEDSAVMLKFSVKCRIEDYHKVRRGLNRELKLMFDRNGISVPFNQVVISDRDGSETVIHDMERKQL